MDRVEAVLKATADKDSLSPQMQRMMNRQAENTRRVEETIKGTKSNPRWFVPLFCALMIIGLIWAVVYYLTSDYPIPNIGAWNLAIAFAIMCCCARRKSEKQTGIEKRNRRTGIGKAVAKDRVRLRKSVKPTKKTYEKIAR